MPEKKTSKEKKVEVETVEVGIENLQTGVDEENLPEKTEDTSSEQVVVEDESDVDPLLSAQDYSEIDAEQITVDEEPDVDSLLSEEDYTEVDTVPNEPFDEDAYDIDENAVSIDEDDEDYEDDDIDSVNKKATSQTTKKVGKYFVGGRLSPDKYTQKARQKWAELFSFKANNRVMTATVIKAAKIGERIVAICKIKNFEEFDCIVPYEWLDIHGEKGVLFENAQIQNVQKLIGVTINVIIVELNEGKIAGNRQLGNYFMRKAFFYQGVHDRPGAKRRVIGKGSIVNGAVVTGVYGNHIRVMIAGASCKIPARELSWKYFIHPHELYRFGDTVKVKITNIEYLHDEALNVKLEASIKALESDPTLLPLAEATLQEVCLATVTGIMYKTGDILLHTATGYNAVAIHMRKNYDVKVGSQVRFRLVKKSEKMGIGTIVELL